MPVQVRITPMKVLWSITMTTWPPLNQVRHVSSTVHSHLLLSTTRQDVSLTDVEKRLQLSSVPSEFPPETTQRYDEDYDHYGPIPTRVTMITEDTFPYATTTESHYAKEDMETMEVGLTAVLELLITGRLLLFLFLNNKNNNNPSF